MSHHQIKRGVSLYSYQEEYFLRTMSLEDCIREAAGIGAYGIETIGEQMMPGFPDLSEDFYKQWHEWMAQYGTTPTAHDLFLDTQLYPGRYLTESECLASIRRDIDHAAKLGATVIRVIVSTPPEILAASASYARDHDVKLLVEVHAPFHMDHPWIQRHLDQIRRVDSEYLGLMPDMGMYVQRIPRVMRDRAVRNGASEFFADWVCRQYEQRPGREALTLPTEVKYMGGGPADIAFASAAPHMVFTEPRRLLEVMDYCHHIQAKFYEMTTDDDGNDVEYSIPYADIVDVLIEGGYRGYLSSEYEGNRHIQDAFEVDSVDQVRRQHRMFTRLLGESA
ncbi:sugar phosphate isomerase/epimerase family protein [Salinactinospora qingdaonensis]|uniref:Xylose isomerase n=1 Tax=Salinactinospora qingdaonensis TaxID=702744 RepID=A0ABP7G8X3_9ACTN